MVSIFGFASQHVRSVEGDTTSSVGLKSRAPLDLPVERSDLLFLHPACSPHLGKEVVHAASRSHGHLLRRCTVVAHVLHLVLVLSASRLGVLALSRCCCWSSSILPWLLLLLRVCPLKGLLLLTGRRVHRLFAVE